jgi:hypothetical protein
MISQNRRLQSGQLCSFCLQCNAYQELESENQRLRLDNSALSERNSLLECRVDNLSPDCTPLADWWNDY